MAAAAQAAASAALSAPDSVQVQQKKPKKQHLHLHRHRHRLSMPCSSFLVPRFSRGLSIRPLPQENHGSRPALWISPVSEIAVDGSANAAAKLDTKSEEDTPEEPPAAIAKEATISAVMADVANLVKLVDSRDIVELELKHLDYELVIRKKEALLPSPAAPALAPPQIVAQAPYPAYAPPPPPAAAVPAPVAAPSPAPAASSPPAPAALPASDLQRILSPMAGTFYKCPAPGEPQLVKVGDKVTKGQVICIVEAMKLMNEIEADQTGTVVEILAEDGKPVAVDTPLFAIKP